MARKSNVEIIKEQKNTIKQLFGAYTILLCAAAIFIFSLHNLFINYMGAKLCMMYLLAPIIFFISNVINKEIGYKNAMMSVGISTFVLFFYGLCTNFIIYNSFNLFSCLGFTIAYLFSQSVSLAIYNYLLVNTRLPIAGVIINYIFDLLIYNMICMIFQYNMIFTDTFWLEYILLVLFQGVFAIVLSLFDSIVVRGID